MTIGTYAAALSYGESGAEGFHAGFSWRPSQKGEHAFLMNAGKLVLIADSVRSAARAGLDVTALVDDTASRAVAGRIEIEPGFAEACRECSGYGAAAEAPSR